LYISQPDQQDVRYGGDCYQRYTGRKQQFHGHLTIPSAVLIFGRYRNACQLSIAAPRHRYQHLSPYLDSQFNGVFYMTALTFREGVT
jgi:hypothetical protein